jgi:hypothetical protein
LPLDIFVEAVVKDAQFAVGLFDGYRGVVSPGQFSGEFGYFAQRAIDGRIMGITG